MLLRYAGVVMGGRKGPLIITGMAPTVVEKRGEFTDRLNAHGQSSSRQWLGGRTWAWTLATNRRSLADALDSSRVVEQAWLDYAEMGSTAAVPLEYSNNGGATWFRVYGRPGRLSTPTPDVRAVQGVALLDLEFIQTDPLHYSSLPSTESITAAPAVSATGWKTPFVFPLRTVESGEPRAGIVQNDGDKSTPLKVTFYGPCTDPVIYRDGLRFGVRGALAYDEQVRIDGRARTVMLSSGVSDPAAIPGRVTSRYTLSELVAPAGRSDWTYSATDPTGTSRAVIEWRDAYTSMQSGDPAATVPDGDGSFTPVSDGIYQWSGSQSGDGGVYIIG